ncbi:hypothetical protein [Aquimarina sp. SS2-1]|uniref:hypothetical protein n=1 Tax=Aquimarina besae TaxID=3342247 RepID=UPI00366E4DA2
MKLSIKTEYILNPLFIVSLAILLLNDFYLKYAYHNWMTGKLSDVFGIIVFALFFTSFVTSGKKYIFILTAVLFGFWKTPLSQFIIDFWNSFQIIQYTRVIDYTDIVCLLILVPVYRFNPSISQIDTKTKLFKTIKYVICGITVFAIMSTSQMRYPLPNSFKLNKYITVKMPKDSLLNQLKTDSIYFEKNGSLIIKKDTLEKYILKNVVLNYDTIQRITIGLKDKRKKTHIYLDSIKINENKGNYYFFTYDKKWLKRYRVDLKDLLKNRDQ